MAKWLISLACLIFALISFGANDSIQNSNKHKISIGFEVNPISYLKWSFPESKTVISNQNSSEEKKDNTKKTVPMATSGLYISYSIFKSLKIQTGIVYSKEEVGGIFLYDTINHNIVERYLRSYIIKFVQIPIIINFKIPDNIKKRSYTNFKSGLNFDFISYEKNSYGTETVLSPSGMALSHINLNGKHRSNKFPFNKITPFVFIGREHFNKSKNFSFSYGSMFTFKSIYQKHNTAEYMKNYKISPLIIGIAYHF